MDLAMKPAFRLYRRGRIYWCQNNQTDKQTSLHTSDRDEARRLLNANNEAAQNPAALNIQIGRSYLAMADPEMAQRTWKDVFDRMLEAKKGSTQERFERAGADKAYEPLWNLRLLETRPDDLNRVLEAGTVATNVFLRRMHNHAFEMGWLPARILSKRQWKKIVHGETRAITEDEHKKITQHELNPERRAFYELCWYTGGSQGDVASLCRESINCEKNTIAYRRRKTAVDVLQKMGPKVKAILDELLATGPLIPHLKDKRASDRATEFKRACRRAGVSGVTLHSYRYAWAERAAKNGYEERYAQAALGHNSKAVARAYARHAEVTTPSLEEYEEKTAAKARMAVAKAPQAGVTPTRSEFKGLSANSTALTIQVAMSQPSASSAWTGTTTVTMCASVGVAGSRI